MAFIEKILAQGEIANSATSVFSPSAHASIYIVKQIIITNHEASADEFGIWLDNDGTTYDDTTVLFEDVDIDANSTVVLDMWLPMDDVVGNLAAKAGTASTLTITVSGAEVT